MFYLLPILGLKGLYLPLTILPDLGQGAFNSLAKVIFMIDFCFAIIGWFHFNLFAA